jgi:hypothetical protein
MAGPDPAIHGGHCWFTVTWMPGSSPGMTVLGNPGTHYLFDRARPFTPLDGI